MTWGGYGTRAGYKQSFMMSLVCLFGELSALRIKRRMEPKTKQLGEPLMDEEMDGNFGSLRDLPRYRLALDAQRGVRPRGRAVESEAEDGLQAPWEFVRDAFPGVITTELAAEAKKQLQDSAVDAKKWIQKPWLNPQIQLLEEAEKKRVKADIGWLANDGNNSLAMALGKLLRATASRDAAIKILDSILLRCFVGEDYESKSTTVLFLSDHFLSEARHIRHGVNGEAAGFQTSAVKADGQTVDVTVTKGLEDGEGVDVREVESGQSIVYREVGKGKYRKSESSQDLSWLVTDPEKHPGLPVGALKFSPEVINKAKEFARDLDAHVGIFFEGSSHDTASSLCLISQAPVTVSDFDSSRVTVR